MQRFRFRLETVLRWRNAEADLEHAKLEALRRDHEQLVSRSKQIEESIAQQRRSLADPLLLPAERASFDHWYTRAKRALDDNASAVRECDRKIADQRARLTAAKQRCELLERLRQRRRAEWAADTDRAVQSEIEEIVISRWKN
jgi:flagellar export protein FliJ